MSKLIAIIGMPGTGKTTVMRKWMESRQWKAERPIDLLDSHVSEDGIRVLGKYEEGETFAGTDRLSMAVQPKAIEFLTSTKDDVIIFEGDRLSSINFLREAVKQGHKLDIIHLHVSDEERERRYAERGSEQDEKFISGRRTKVANICEEFGAKPLLGEEGCVMNVEHDDEQDTKYACQLIDTCISY